MHPFTSETGRPRLTLTLLPMALVLLRPGATLTRHVVAVCEMLFSALLIDITGGRIETHFYVFGALALLAFYRDWRVLIIASAVVAIHHGVFGVFAPQNIYGVSIIQPWRWVQHTAWVVFEDVFLIISITQSLKEMMGLAERQASLETVNARIEQQGELRTGELERSRTEALKAIGYDGMPLLMLTSDDLKIEFARVRKLGLDAYLVKPVRRLELFEAIAAAMTRHKGDLRPAGETSAASSAGALVAPPRPLRVLLTEDSRENRILIRAYLKKSGARVDEAENGLIAVEKAKTEKYDL